MRARFYLFAAIVFLALVAHLVLLTSRVAQSSEDMLRSRLAAASSAVRTQIALLDSRISPLAAAQSPELVEATRAPADPNQAVKPDEGVLRSAAAALQQEPDLIVVGGAKGAVISRRSKAATPADAAVALELANAALEGPSAARFATYEGTLYRIASARISGNPAALVVGDAIDDRFAAQLRTQVDGDVSFLADGAMAASSLTSEGRGAAARWANAPSAGYGVLPVPVNGLSLSGKLPFGSSRLATRAALVPLDSGVQAVVSVPAAPYLSWLGRYQALYVVALLLYVVLAVPFGFLFPKAAQVARAPGPAPRLHPSPPIPASRSDAAARSRALLGADVSAPSESLKPAPPPSEVPWAAGSEDDGVISGPTPLRRDETPIEPSLLSSEAAAETATQTAAVAGPRGGLEAEGAWTVGEPQRSMAEPGPASLYGEEAPQPIAAPAKREPELEAALQAPTDPGEPSIPPETEVPGEAENVLAPPGAPGFSTETPTGEHPVGAALIERMRERDEGEPPVVQKAPDRAPADLGIGWEPPSPAEAASEPAWSDSVSSLGTEEPAPAPWNESPASLPADAATPRFVEPIRPPADEGPIAMESAPSEGPIPTESAPSEGMDTPMDQFAQEWSGAPGAAEPSSEGRFATPPEGPPVIGTETPFEGAPVSGILTPLEGPPADEHLEEGTEGAAMDTSLEGAPLTRVPTPPQGAPAAMPEESQEGEATAEGETMAEGEAFAQPEGLAAIEEDPDELHFQEIFEQFLELRQQTGEPGNVSYEKFAAKLRKNREELMARHHATGVRFSVYLKEGRAAIKASALR